MTPLGLGQLRLFPFSRALLSCAKQCPALQRSCACSQLLEAAEALSWRPATSYRYYHTNTDRNCCGFHQTLLTPQQQPSGLVLWCQKLKSKLIAKSTSGRDHCAESWTHLNGLQESVGVGIYNLRTMRSDLLSQGGIKGWISLWKSPGCCVTVHTPMNLNIE